MKHHTFKPGESVRIRATSTFRPGRAGVILREVEHPVGDRRWVVRLDGEEFAKAFSDDELEHVHRLVRRGSGAVCSDCGEGECA